MLRLPSRVLFLRVLGFTALAGLASCGSREEGAIRFNVELDARLRAECVSFVGSSNGRRVVSGFFVRSPGKHAYTVGVARASLPATLSWQATAVMGSCGDEVTWKVTSVSEERSVTFPETGVQQQTLRLDLPGPELDADRDTWVDVAKRGEDCNDADAAVNPGAPQVCGSTADANCDGKLFCDDPSCASDAACQRSATRLAVPMPPTTVVNHECSPEVRLVATDEQNQPTPVSRTTAIALTGPSGLEFFTDATCQTPVAGGTISLGFGQSMTSVWFRARSTGPATVQASTTALGMTSFTVTITEQPIAELRALPTTLSVASSLCSQRIDVSAFDAQGRPTNATSLVDLTALVEPAGTTGVQFFTDASCSPAAQGTPRISAGTSTTAVWVRATQATPRGMPLTLRFGAVGVTTPASVALTVTAGAPDRVAFREMGVSVQRAMCSTQNVELQLLDAQGNQTVAGPGGAVVTLSVSPPPGGGTLTFFTAAGCGSVGTTTSVTIPAGQDSQRLFLNASSNGRYTVTASFNAMMAPPLEVSVAVNPPSALVFPNQATTVNAPAGACSRAVRVQTRETSNPASALSGVQTATVVNVAANPAGRATFFSDAACMTPLSQLNFAVGDSERTFYFRGRLAGAFAIEATRVSGDTLSDAAPAQPAAIDPGQTSRLEFTTPLTVSVEANACTPAFGLLARDAFDNPTRANFQVTPSAVPVPTDGGVVFFAGPGCSNTAGTVSVVDGGATFFAQARAARAYAINAQSSTPSALTQLPDGGSGAVTLTVTPAPPTVLVVTSQPAATMQAGTCQSITIERRDAFGNPVAGAAQGFTASASMGAVLSVHADNASCTAGTVATGLQFVAGSSTATFSIRGRQVGSSTVTVMGMGSATTSSVAVSAGPVQRLEFAGPPTTSTVGGCATATVRRLDGEGNLTTLPGGFMATVTASGATNNLRLGSTCPVSATATMQTLSFASADSASFAFEPRAVGTLTFTATATGLPPPDATFSTTVGVGPVASVRFVSTPTSPQLAATCIQVELEALDVGNNRVAATANLMNSLGGAFYLAMPCTGAPVTSVTLPAGGSLNFFYRPTATGMHMLTADPPGAVPPASITFQVDPGTPTTLVRTPGFMTNTESGSCVTFTLERRDAAGNPTTGGGPLPVTATLTGTAGASAQLFSMAGCTGAGMPSIGDGASSGQFSVRPQLVGPLTLALSSSLTTNPGNTSTTVVPGPVVSVSFVTPPTGPQLAASCIPLEVEALDAGGNRVAASVSLTNSLGGTFFSSVTCTGGTITSGLVPAAGTFTFFYRPTATGMHTVSADPAGPVGPGTATFQVDPGDPTTLVRTPGFMTNTESGSCVTFTLERRDGAGNQTTRGGPLPVTATLTGTAGASAQLFSMAGCTGAGMPSIGDGASSGQFSVRPQLVGELTLSLSSSLATNPMATSTTVGPGPLTSLQFTTMPPQPSVVVGTCTLATLEGRDAAMNLTALGSNITLAMMGGSATFHRIASCGDTATTTIAGSAATSVNFYVRPTAPGTSLALTATTAPSLSAMQSWTFVAPAATTLRFKAPAPGSVSRLSCTGPYRFESTDGTNAVPSGADRVITFGGTNVQYFSDPGCSLPITTIDLPAAQQETNEFYLVVFANAASVTLSGTAVPPLTTASANVTVTGNLGALTLQASAPNLELEYRACTPLTFERRVMGVAFGAGDFPTVLSLSKTGTGASGATFHAANDCTGVELTSATIPSGMASVTVYVAGRSAERQGTAPTFTVATAATAAADGFAGGFGTGSVTFNVHPAVRRGSCAIANNQTSTTATQSTACTISPALPAGARARSFFTFQTSLPNLAGASVQNTTCELNAGATALECSRHSSSNNTLNIEWQLVSLGAGLSVRHLKQSIGSAMPRTVTTPLGAELAAANTFLLVSHKNQSGGLDWDDFPVSELVGMTPGNVSTLETRNGSFDFQTPVELNAQVVTWTGLSVVTGIVTGGAGASFTGTAPGSTGTEALLYTTRIGASGSAAICRHRLRGTVVAGIPTFSRGAGAMGACTDVAMAETVWSRLSFPSSIATVSAPMSAISIPNGQSNSSWAVGRPLPLDRTWVFLGGQGPGGQSGGESARAGGSDDDLGTLAARVTYGADGMGNTLVTLTRGSTSSNSFFSPFAVVLTP